MSASANTRGSSPLRRPMIRRSRFPYWWKTPASAHRTPRPSPARCSTPTCSGMTRPRIHKSPSRQASRKRAAPLPSCRAVMQLVTDGDSHLAGVAQLQKSLGGEVRRDQSKIEALLGVAGIEEIAHPQARGPRTRAVADADVLQVICPRGLRVARVVVEAVDGRGVQAR